MNRSFRLGFGLVLVMLLAGCQVASPHHVAGTGSAPVPLQGTNWQLTGFVEDGVTTALADGTSIPMSINDGRLHAQPCNTLVGPVAIDGSSFKSGELVSTMMMCFGDQGEQETRFIDTLGAVTKSEITGDKLTLSTSDGRALVFVAEL